MQQYFSSHQEQQIRRLIRDCGQQVEQLAAEHFQVFQKGPNDYVTTVDRALDQALASAFHQLFPGSGVITEENSVSRTAFTAGYDHLWVIDPLDGTEDFIQGNQSYAVMVGLLKAAQPLAGWVYSPARDQMYFGGPEWGLFQSRGDQPPEPLQPIEPPAPSAEFCPMIVGTADQRTFGRAIRHLIPEAQIYSLGSFGLKVLEVIQGRAGLYVYLNRRVKVWDTAGPLALAQASGLICCDLEGHPLRFDPDAIHPDTLAHYQEVVIGWPQYIEALQPRLVEAVALTQQQPVTKH